MKLRWGAITAVCCGLITSNASADTFSVYYDRQTWNAATAGLAVGPYTRGITEINYTTTIEILDNFGLGVIDTTVDVYPYQGFSGFAANFSFASPCEFTVGCQITSTSDVMFVFDRPIIGFWSETSGNFDDTLRINGDLSLGLGEDIGGGYGVVWAIPISSIELSAGFTDDFEYVYWSNIVVATTPEPATLSLFAMGLVAMKMKRKALS